VDCFYCEGRQADCNIFGSAFGRCGVLDPFAAVGDDCLARYHVQFAGLVFYVHRAFQHDGEFVELWSLSRLFPTLRAEHVGDAYAGSPGVDAADEFVNQFGLGAGGTDARRLSDRVGIASPYIRKHNQSIKRSVEGASPQRRSAQEQKFQIGNRKQEAGNWNSRLNWQQTRLLGLP
jgi:hypothetical protein